MNERTNFEGLPAGERHGIIQRYEEMKSGNDSFYFEIPAYEKIIEFYEEQEDIGKAMEAAETAISQHPYSAVFLVKKAEFLLDRKQYKQAMEYLDQATIFDPMDINIIMLRADIYAAKKDFEAAISLLKEASRTADRIDKVDLYVEMADVYEEWDKYDAAFSCLSKAAALSPKNPELLDRLWFNIEMTEEYEKGAGFFQKFIDQYPYNHLAWYNLAFSYTNLGLHEKAAEAFEYVIIINEKFKPVYKDYAETLIDLKKFDKALEVLQTSLELEGDSEPLYYLFGRCYEKTQQFFQAKRYYKKVTHLNPKAHQAYYRMGRIYEKESQWVQAIVFYKRAQEIKPRRAKYEKTLGMTYFILGNTKKGINSLKNAVELSPKKIKYRIKLAEGYLLKERPEKALDVIDEALAEFGERPRLLYTKASFLFYYGKRKQALQFLEHALSLKPEKYLILDAYLSNWKKDREIIEVIQQYKTI